MKCLKVISNLLECSVYFSVCSCQSSIVIVVAAANRPLVVVRYLRPRLRYLRDSDSSVLLLFVALHLFIDDGVTVDAFVVVYYLRSTRFVLDSSVPPAGNAQRALSAFRNLFVNKVALCFVVFPLLVLGRHPSFGASSMFLVRASLPHICNTAIYFHLFHL